MCLDIQKNIYEKLLLDRSQGDFSFEDKNLVDTSREIPVENLISSPPRITSQGKSSLEAPLDKENPLGTGIGAEDALSRKEVSVETQIKERESQDYKNQFTAQTDRNLPKAATHTNRSHDGSADQSHGQS